MRSAYKFSLVLSAVSLGLALGAGCGGGSDTNSGGAGGAGATGGSNTGGSTGGSTTASVSASNSSSASSAASSSSGTGGTGGFEPMCRPTNGTVLAVTKLYLGDKNFDDSPNVANGWKQFGFNVDGKVSTAQSVDLCQPKAGGMKSKVYPDGDNGIDNSFGKNILPTLLTLQADFSDTANQGITDGSYTVMLKLEDLMAGPDQSPVIGKVYGGGDLGMAPNFDGNDCWPVTPELLNDVTDIDTPKIVFSGGALASDVWTSGVTSSVTLTFTTQVGAISLTLHQAQMSLTLDPDHKGGTMGMLGGVLDTEEFLVEVEKLIYNVSPLFCHAYDDQIRQASDIMVDGSQDPAKTCDGISIGLGFKVKEVQFGGIGPATPPSVNMCL